MHTGFGKALQDLDLDMCYGPLRVHWSQATAFTLIRFYVDYRPVHMDDSPCTSLNSSTRQNNIAFSRKLRSAAVLRWFCGGSARNLRAEMYQL